MFQFPLLLQEDTESKDLWLLENTGAILKGIGFTAKQIWGSTPDQKLSLPQVKRNMINPDNDNQPPHKRALNR